LLSLIQTTVEDLQHAHQEHKIIINSMVNSIVSADKNRIAEVLTILINNAIRYSPSANEVLIDMFQDDKQNTITVRIKDFGIGIPEEERESMFKRFFRTSRVQRFKIPGTGLGLYIASEIIKKHNGRIWFESKLDEGSEFYFSLPEF
jgi:signal transduction histidine kinase